MLLGIVIAGLVAIYIFTEIFDFFRTYKTKHYKIKCNICGSEDTVVKNNDRLETVTFGIRKGKYLERNPPSFYCNQCKKEYDYKEGTWIKKSR